MVAAADIGIVIQKTCKESIHSLVSFAGDTTIKCNSGGLQRVLGSAADAAADQRGNMVISQKLSQ